MRPHFALPLALAAALAGCAGQVRLNAGAAGPGLPPGSTIALLGAPQSDIGFARKAQEEVTAALARRGHAITSDAPTRLEIGLTDRFASTGIAVIGGQDLSPAKRKKFLQSCKDRTYRLMLAYYGSGSDVPVTRAWAEEYHCKGRIEASIAALADKAVAALAAGSSSDVSKRRSVE